MTEQSNKAKEVENRNDKKAGESESQNKNILIRRKKTVKYGSGPASSRKERTTPGAESPKDTGQTKTPKKM